MYGADTRVGRLQRRVLREVDQWVRDELGEDVKRRIDGDTLVITLDADGARRADPRKQHILILVLPLDPEAL